ncbi:hypothetical protein [Corynebacterium lizhenjunii]|uniref:hypothetical protein n=1 Tax=Corynebacterium lizhenjunii TaxID=2709394 RepID=UPI0013EBB70F|nr:hypothetical protein [Corynebacterium lizhenjunii]
MTQKWFAVGSLVALVAGLALGLAVSATHIALGTFLLAMALMLGPFAGVGLLGFAAAVAASGPQKSLAWLGGSLLLAAVGLVMFTPMGVVPTSALPLYVTGAGLGALAVALLPATQLPATQLRARQP